MEELFSVSEVSAKWKPKGNILDYDPYFVDWIDNINKGGDRMYEYRPFVAYIKQATSWIADKYQFDDYKQDAVMAKRWLEREKLRLQTNSLYYLNKYHYIMEGDVSGGFMKYKAYRAQQIIAFLFDCGYSVIFGKGRQVFFTTTMGGIVLNRVNSRDNYKCIYIADEKKKAEVLFKEKIRWPHKKLPTYLQHTPTSQRDQVFALNNDSYVEVLAAKDTSATGYAANFVALDEIGLNANLSGIISEVRPTLLMYNPQTSRLELRRQVFAWGCVCAGTKVWNNNGDLVNIEDLNKEDGILGYSGDGISKEKITYWQPTAKKPCVKITTHTGRTLECSADHPILWSNARFGTTLRKDGRKFRKKMKFVEAGEIKATDHVMVIDSVPVFGKKKLWNPRLIGWLVADGTYGIDHSPRLFNCDDEITDYVLENFDAKITRGHITKDLKKYREIRIKGICQKLRDIGIYGQTKLRKTLPQNIHSYDKHSICELLSGIFEADGCVHYTAGSTRITLESSSFNLLSEIRLLIQKLGVHGSIDRIKACPERNPRSKNDWYRFSISDKRSVLAFRENMHFWIKYKQERLDFICSELEKRKSKISQSLSNKCVRVERVVSVEDIGLKDIYNLTAGTTHTYIANGIITHNTGGQMDRGGAAMEMEWNAAKEKWEHKDYEYGIIPVRFNVFWREGMTREVYDLEKKRAYAKKGPKRDAIIRQFHQHNPITERDMFIRGNNTLVSEAQIQTHLDRIRNMKDRPQRGFMEPILLGDKISGVNFVPANDSDASPIIILKHPEKGWKHRYYKGTDPVNSSTGASKMASTVWDSHENSIPAILNYKEKNYDYIYEQSMLLNIYYDKPKELIEINAGEAYVKYLNDHNMGHVIVGNKALPKHLQSNTMVGIHNIGKANRYIVNEIMHMLESYADNLNMEIFWEQMSRFVEKQKPSGETKWEAEDKRYYQDDTIFSTVFAYLCSLCYGKYTPREIKGDESAMVKRKFYLDENFNMRPGYFKGNKLIRDGIPNGKR